MPYTINDDSLPSYVKKLPFPLRSKWISIFDEVYKQDGEELAFVVANQWLSEHKDDEELYAGFEGDGKSSTAFNKDLIETEDVSEDTNVEENNSESEEVVTPEVINIALSKVIKRLEKLEDLVIPKDTSSEDIILSFAKDGDLVKRADGTQYVDFILTDNGYDAKGLKMKDTLLSKWADAINKGELVIKGDTNHKDWDLLMEKGVSKDKFIPFLKKFKKGFAKSIKAIVDNGKLWIRAQIAKGYEDLIAKASGVSLEARLDIDEATKEAYDGDLGGFTFTVGVDPINPRSKIYKK